MDTVTAFAPGTVSNLAVGFDVLGVAIEGAGDTVTVRKVSTPGVRIVHIEGDDGRLPRSAEDNTASIAAASTLRAAGVEMGLELTLHKGLSLCSGMGSSAASAVAAAYATNVLIGGLLRKVDLVGPCLDAEERVAGRHADNVAPSLLGGWVLIRSLDPIDLIRLPVPDGLTVVAVMPEHEVATKAARAVLPKDIPMSEWVASMANMGAFVSSCYTGDLARMSRSLVDGVVAPARLPLIPGGEKALSAAMSCGALGASISGAGPTLFALCRSDRSARAASVVMEEAFAEAGISSRSLISPADCPGVRRMA